LPNGPKRLSTHFPQLIAPHEALIPILTVPKKPRQTCPPFFTYCSHRASPSTMPGSQPPRINWSSVPALLPLLHSLVSALFWHRSRCPRLSGGGQKLIPLRRSYHPVREVSGVVAGQQSLRRPAAHHAELTLFPWVDWHNLCPCPNRLSLRCRSLIGLIVWADEIFGAADVRSFFDDVGTPVSGLTPSLISYHLIRWTWWLLPRSRVFRTLRWGRAPVLLVLRAAVWRRSWPLWGPQG
jgi:hypothetical protein